MATHFLLHESPLGYSLFKISHELDTVAQRLKETQDTINDLARFGKTVSVVSFLPFESGAAALKELHDISEGQCSDALKAFLDGGLPKAGKKSKVVLGVSDKVLAGSIKSALQNAGLEMQTAETSEVVGDMLRGVRLHGEKLLKELREGDTQTAQLGLGHAYSRAKVKFSITRDDNHLIQAIAIIDTLDKNINTFSMRVREWYSYSFPELVKLVSDNHLYAQVVLHIGDKNTLSDDSLPDLAAVLGDNEELAKDVISASKTSMGQQLSATDMDNVTLFASRVVSLANYRKTLHSYLVSKMGTVAPNLAALIGEIVGARLISHAGSLTNLSKYPASTVQILGAEKALFRALKTKGNTPKYGLLYHSSFIGRAGQKNKGRISRFLANKCSIASRIDNFSETPSTVYGQALKKQVEERLEFYASGAQPTKNETAMKNAMDKVLEQMDIDEPSKADEEMFDAEPTTVGKQEKKEKDKSEKKEKSKRKSDVDGESKKKKRKSDVDGEGDSKKKKKKSKD